MAWILTHTGVFLLTTLLLLAPGVIWNALLLRRPTSLADRLLVLLTMGFATWTAILFLLCATHLLLRPVVAVTAGALLAAALVSARRLGTSERGLPTGASWMILVPTGALLAAIFLIALAPLPGIDADHYHLTIPRLYVEAHGFRSIPFSVQSNWPLNAELLFAGVLLFADHVSAGLLHFAFGLGTSVLLFGGCLQALGARGHWPGAVSVALFWSSRIIQYDGWVANNDLAVTFFLLATLLACWRALEDRASATSWMFVGGVCAGMLAGTKINGVFAIVPVALYVAWRLARRDAGETTTRGWLLYGVVPAFLLAVVWPIKSWMMTGNPAYPFLYGVFGGPEWSSALTERFQKEMLALGMGRTWKDYLLLPLRVILFSENDFDHFGGIVNRAWIVLLPAAIVLGWRDRLVRTCLFVAALLFVAWAMGSQQVRYLIPAFAPLSLATGLAVKAGIDRYLAGSRPAMLLPTLGTAAIALSGSPPVFQNAFDWTSSYVRYGRQMPGLVVKPVFKFINTSLPPDARIVLINNNRTYFVQREYIVDSFFLASQVADWLGKAHSPEDLHRMLRDAHVSHLLVAGTSDGTEYPRVLLSFLQEQRGLRLAFRDEKNGLELFGVCERFDCSP